MTRYEAIEKAAKELLDAIVAESYPVHTSMGELATRNLIAAVSLPDDSKTVNAELYGLAVELADDAAKAAIECLCMVDKPGSNTHVLIGRQTRHGPYVDLAARYLSLREASGEPMPYKVVREGDKVRFTDAAPQKDGE